MTSLFKVFLPHICQYHTGRQFLLKSEKKINFSGILQISFTHNMSQPETNVASAGTEEAENGGDSQGPSLSVEGNTGALSKRAVKKMERMRKWKQQQGKKSKPRKPGAPEPGFGAHLYEETDYYYENGLRKVYPYYYTFTTYVKQRWLGRTILDVFSSEFRAHSEQDYTAAIESGHLTVNGKKVSSDYILKDNELLAHRLHRHENPVVGCPIEVLVNTDDLIVINKPSSIPCHPCGKYRHNSVVFIVGRQMGCANLRNIYRLDRLTSGVLIMGKTSQKTKELEDQVLKKLVRKEYVCRVVGEFPDEKIECNEPIGVISQKLGLFRVRPDGKTCHTTFEKLSYNGKTSVVRCCPHTGRTHQIRVHLQYLGHPIVNDPFYNSEAWGPNKNKGGIMERTDQEVSDHLMVLHNIGHWTEGVNPLYAERLKEMADDEHKLPEGCELEGSQKESSWKINTSDDTTESRNIIENSRTSSLDGMETVSVNGNNISVGEAGVLPGGSEEPPAKKTRTDGSEVTSQEQLQSEDSSSMSERTIQDLSAASSKDVHLPPFDRSKWIPDVNCQSCRLKYVDPTQKELVMYLHALKYTGPDWEYSTPLPDWAKEDWVED